MKKSNVDETLISFATSVSYVAILAVGLVLKGFLPNFASGVLMIIFHLAIEAQKNLGNN